MKGELLKSRISELDLQKAENLNTEIEIEFVKLFSNKGEEFAGLGLKSANGYLLDYSVVKAISAGLQYFIENVTQEDIDRLNMKKLLEEKEIQERLDLEAELWDKMRAEREKGVIYFLSSEEGYKVYYISNNQYKDYEKHFEKVINKKIQQGFTLVKAIRTNKHYELKKLFLDKFKPLKQGSWYQLTHRELEFIHSFGERYDFKEDEE